jgi:NAD(P)-dependent dehydrogenase (short-subunit alcohol dehydrogenase family)
MTLGVNHLGHALLARLLEDRLRASAPSRIVFVASEAHRRAKGGLDFDDLMMAKGKFQPMLAYSRSKLANILFTYELGRRLDGTGVSANTVHPGAVATNWGDTGSVLLRLGLRLGRPFLLKPAQGADTPLYLATSPEVEGVSGKYFVKRRETPSPQLSYDEDVARKLWDVSAQITGLN